MELFHLNYLFISHFISYNTWGFTLCLFSPFVVLHFLYESCYPNNVDISIWMYSPPRLVCSGECQRQCDEQRHRGQHQAENHAVRDARAAAGPQRPSALRSHRAYVHRSPVISPDMSLIHLTALFKNACGWSHRCVFRWQGEDGGDGGREVPPVCPSLALRQWSNHRLHSSGRGVWAHVVPHQHPR